MTTPTTSQKSLDLASRLKALSKFGARSVILASTDHMGRKCSGSLADRIVWSFITHHHDRPTWQVACLFSRPTTRRITRDNVLLAHPFLL